MIKIAPSILSANFARLLDDVQRVEKAGADYLHLDVMDGHFVPNITIGPLVVAALRPHTHLTFDVHLMIEDPDRYIDAFVEAGADLITVHAEACPHLHRTLTHIRDKGARCGVALNPATPPEVLEYLPGLFDLVLVMTVNPGFGGQAFIPQTLVKIEKIRKMIDDAGLDVEIQVDGGINTSTAPLVVRAGATVLVAGSAIFSAPDPAVAIRDIRQASENISENIRR
ncbi:ribulose-5-phosphate 3-epimerase [Desulfofundulus australicus DSM 11792]|uniref:Ribulose-phosphate 3-epimerase n=1 Tax=Desulfofundulus australicus DSM 11792 TaxID=1121425 RepID=A0A1M4U1Q3_9FIRM|nr:ribulose-phosphate 3-epimerase [Desulfofundulus australicus]SHE50662.1 ribulose-5-phosphate 3-epimerase [Desulfofundulus australicus DSM 11792]